MLLVPVEIRLLYKEEAMLVGNKTKRKRCVGLGVWNFECRDFDSDNYTVEWHVGKKKGGYPAYSRE